MASNYCLAVTVVFLLLLQSAQDVPECVYTYNQFTSPENIVRCIEVEDIFEGALLEEKVNCHTLRKAFLSSLHPSPQLLNVMYSIDTSSRTPSDSTIGAIWSSSQVFTIIDPMILHDLQSGIMTIVYFMEGILFPETVTLYLNLSSHHSLTENEHIYGIISITEKVSILELLIS